tara:strand:+ start:301 stop:624 length:324 start_codon:yes stop_codon:yes gene_type:complete
MKLTKHKLKQLIKEELDSLQELEKPEKLGIAKLGAGAAMKTARQSAVQQKATGITDLERSVMEKLQTQLLNAAQTTNIATGKVLRYANLLSQELQKLGVSDQPRPKK